MSRILLSAALMVAALSPIQFASAQNPGRYTLRVKRPAWFGFALDCTDSCGANTPPGAASGTRPVITRIWPDGPAARAALQVGDTIVTVDGKPLDTPELRKKIEALSPDATLRLIVGGRRGRSTISLQADSAKFEVFGRDTLPVRYHAEYAEVTVDVMTTSAPMVSRDSTGAMIIKVGQHVIRLQRAP